MMPVRAALSFVLALPALAGTCLTLPGAGKAPIAVASETAILSWNPATKIERFVRTAEFRNDGGPIGFLVPTPTPPKLNAWESSNHRQVLAELEGIVRPRYVDRKRPVYRLTEGWDIIPPAKIAAKSLGMGAMMYAGDADDVLVLDQKRVGGYDTAVLRAKDPAALLRWLGKHGFASDARLTEWLRPYTEHGWAITAFRFAPGAGRFASEPVELAFKTDRPFYPYREPRAESAPADRKLRVFVVTPERVAGRLDDGEPWATAPEFSGPLPSRGNYWVAPMLSLPGEVVDGYWVTSFLDRTPVRPERELVFDPSVDPRPVEPPPVVRWVDDPVDLPKGAVAMGVGLPALAVAGLLLRRRRTTGRLTPQ